MRYRIEHRLSTLAELWEPLEYKGFLFANWETKFPRDDSSRAWIATKHIDAENVSDALTNFRLELLHLANRIAFVSQCFVGVETESFLIHKTDSPLFFFRYVQQIGPVPLAFRKEEIDSLIALEAFDEKGEVFATLREYGNASTYLTRLGMLAAALEAIAAKEKGSIGHDKDFIRKEILKSDDLYAELFKRGTGVRHRLFHGAQLDLAGKENYAESIYWKIVSFFNDRHGTKINKAVVNPQRHFFGNFETMALWLEIRTGDFVPDLRSVWEDYYRQEKAHIHYNSANYRIVEKVDSY